MEERFDNEFVTWNHKTPVGIKVNEVFGMDSKSGKVWNEIARQIFSEQGDPNYLEIDHYDNGVPYIPGLPCRISVTHTNHFFAVAFLPRTPEADLSVFSPRTAMGIDAESLSRTQVIKIREKFLSLNEQEQFAENDLEKNILAWTAKEAIYKACLTPGLIFSENIEIISLPEIDRNPENSKKTVVLGRAKVIFSVEGQETTHEFNLYSWESYGCCVTIAYSPKCARFGGH